MTLLSGIENKHFKKQSVNRLLEQFQERDSVLHKKGSWGDWTLLLSIEDREQHRLFRYAWVTCGPADGTPSTKRFHSTRWCPSTLRPYSEKVSEEKFPNRWTGRERPKALAPRSPDIATLDSLGRDQVFQPKVGSAVELRMPVNSAVASVTCQMLENTKREIEYRLTFCELQMALTLRYIKLDELFFQVKQTNSRYLVHSVIYVYLKCGEWIV
jgi:hypothetical protein